MLGKRLTTKKLIPLTKIDVKNYLDECIIFWRNKRDASEMDSVMSNYYIDAFQSVRVSLFGELLEDDLRTKPAS